MARDNHTHYSSLRGVMRWFPSVALMAGAALALPAPDSSAVPDLTSLVQVADSAHLDTLHSDSVAVSKVVAPDTAPQAKPRPGLIHWSGSSQPVRAGSAKPLALFLGEGDGGPWFALGVLEAVERYRIPLQHVIGAGWSAWVAAAWAEGYSTTQVRAMLQRSDALDSTLLWNTRPAEPMQASLLDEFAQDGFPAMSLAFTSREDKSAPIRVAGHLSDSSPGPSLVARLLLEQPLLELTADKSVKRQAPVRVPWGVLLCNEDLAQPQASPDRPPLSWVLVSAGVEKSVPGSASLAPLQRCGILRSADLEASWPGHGWIVAQSWPERAGAETPAILRRGLAVTEQDTANHWIHVRPHAARGDSLRSGAFWEHSGFESVRARLGELGAMGMSPKAWDAPEKTVPSLEVVQPAFDDVPAEYQNHLSSYWPEAERWDGDVLGFSATLARDGLYDSLTIGLVSQKTTDLEDGRELSVPVLAVRALPRPRFELSAGGFGSSLTGPEFAGSMRLRFVNQFEYDFSMLSVYGELCKGFEPSVRISRISSGNLGFTLRAELLNLDYAAQFGLPTDSAMIDASIPGWP